MSKMEVLAPEVTGDAGAPAQELTPEQKAEREEFLKLKLADLQARAQTVKDELESLK